MSEDLVGQEAVTDARIKQIAAAVMSGKTVKNIVAETHLTEYTINKIKKSEPFKEYLTSMSESVIKDAQTELKHEIAKRAKKILAALDRELDGDKPMEAIKTGLRVLSVLDPKEQGQADQGPLVVKFDLTGKSDQTTIELPRSDE